MAAIPKIGTNGTKGHWKVSGGFERGRLRSKMLDRIVDIANKIMKTTFQELQIPRDIRRTDIVNGRIK